MRFKSVALGLAAGLLASASHAASMQEALQAAYNNNPTLNAQRAATRASDENLPQAKAGFRPQITASADVSVTRSVTRTPVSTTETDLVPHGFGVTISQNLFNGFQTVNSVQAAQAGILASRETLRNVEQNTLLSAATAYADVLQTRDLVDIRRRNIAFLKEQLRSSQARLDVGEGTRTDVAQSQAGLANAQAQLTAAMANYRAAQGVFRQNTGIAATALSWPRLPRTLLPKSLPSAQSTGLISHPAIRATEHLVDAANFNVKRAEGALLPSLNLQGEANQRYNSANQVDGITNLQATLSLSVPLYQAGAASSAVRQNKETLGQRRIEVDQARDQVRSQIVSAWSQLQAARANLVANREQLKAAKLALEGVVEERNVGQRTQLDVLNAQNAVLLAEEAILGARRSEIVATYGLIGSVGRLSSRRLSLAVTHYTPKRHYDQVKDKWFGLRTPDGR